MPNLNSHQSLLIQYCLMAFFLFTDYVDEMYNTLTRTLREKLECIRDELAEEKPEALHTMLPDKEDKEVAKNKYCQRKAKETVLCPPTYSDIENVIVKKQNIKVEKGL